VLSNFLMMFFGRDNETRRKPFILQLDSNIVTIMRNDKDFKFNK
jgi:hypothetical protein